MTRRITIAGEPERRCPHGEVQHCPLYIASHGGASVGLGCVWGDWSQGCAIDRGDQAYGPALEALAVADPLLVARALAAEREAESQAQRRRNLLAAGLRP